MEGAKRIFRVALATALLVPLVLLMGFDGRSSRAPESAIESFAVADSGNSRVIIYDNHLSTKGHAGVVLGQSSFNQGSRNQGSGPTANTLSGPHGITKDSAGNLYVADSANCRVLQFHPPFTTGMSASVVIGQPGFTETRCVVQTRATSSGMDLPISVAVDHNGNLWVSDNWNSRVLEYVPPFRNGMPATLALGQVSTGNTGANPCNRGSAAPTSSTLCTPAGASFDMKGNLWVSDCVNNRVLEYTPPFSTGMAASLELGQPATMAFISNSPDNGGVSASSLFCPGAPAFDSSGNLWVADEGNNRVLEFVPPFSNGMVASTVIGQTDFTHEERNRGGSIPDANTLSIPMGLDFDSSGKLSVTDFNNNRVLIFAPPFHNGMNASTVVGQEDFTHKARNQGSNDPTADTFQSPVSVLTF